MSGQSRRANIDRLKDDFENPIKKLTALEGVDQHLDGLFNSFKIVLFEPRVEYTSFCVLLGELLALTCKTIWNSWFDDTNVSNMPFHRRRTYQDSTYSSRGSQWRITQNRYKMHLIRLVHRAIVPNETTAIFQCHNQCHANRRIESQTNKAKPRYRYRIDSIP